MNFSVFQVGMLYKVNKTYLCKLQKSGNTNKMLLTKDSWFDMIFVLGQRRDRCLICVFVEKSGKA